MSNTEAEMVRGAPITSDEIEAELDRRSHMVEELHNRFSGATG